MNRSQCPFCGWGILLGSYPLVRSPGVPPGTLSVGTLRSRGTDDTCERHGPGWEAGRLTYIPDDESVGPFRPLPPASHGGEGPVIEAVGIPGARTQETEEGMEQGTNPFCPGALSYCSSSCGLSYSQQEGAMRGLQVQALAPGWSQELRGLCQHGEVEKANVERTQAWESHRSGLTVTLSGAY